MATIIKAADRQRAVQHEAFNFRDLAAQANQYLDQVRAEAAAILARAHEEAAAIRARAEADGEADAAQTARQMATSLAQQRTATLLPALQQAAGEISQAKAAWLAHWEQRAIHLAVAIAGRVVRRELPRQPEIPLTLIREALELAAGSAEWELHLHPDDHRSLGPQVDAVIRELAPLASARVVADPEITRGGCRVETRFGTIDQQFEAQLARIEEELA